MAKTMRGMRLDERTWSQLEQLQGWLQVGNRTKVIEILAEKEATLMGKKIQDMVEVLKASGYQAGDVTKNTFIVFSGRAKQVVEKPDPGTNHVGQGQGSTYVTSIHNVTVAALNQALSSATNYLCPECGFEPELCSCAIPHGW